MNLWRWINGCYSHQRGSLGASFKVQWKTACSGFCGMMHSNNHMFHVVKGNTEETVVE